MGALAVLVLSGHAHIWHFVVGELVAGAAMAFTGPTLVALLPSLVPQPMLQSANSLTSTSRNVARIVGPALAGALVALGSAGWALGVDALSFLVSGALMLRLPVSRGTVRAGATVWGDVRHGWHAFASRRWVWLMVLSFASYQATTLPAIFVLGPILSEREYGGATTWAVVLSARAVGAVLVGLVLLRWRPRRPLMVSAGIVLLDVPFLLTLAGGLPVAVLVATSVVSSAGLIAADTLWESSLQSRVPSDVLSRVSSYDWLGSIIVNPVGFAFIGAAASGLGAGPVLLAAMGVLVVVHALLLVSPSIRATPTLVDA
jgi:MFS family permease